MSSHTPILELASLSVFYGWWYVDPPHFQSNPIVDPFSGALAAVGFSLGVGALFRRRRDAFLVPGYLLSAFIAGAITPHSRPPLTRLLFLAPLMAMFSAVALDQLLRFMTPRARQRMLPWGLGGSLIIAAVVWNVAALQRSIYHTNRGYGDGTTSELIRLVQQLPATYHVLYIQRDDTYMGSVDYVLAEYDMDRRSTYLRPFDHRALATLKDSM